MKLLTDSEFLTPNIILQYTDYLPTFYLSEIYIYIYKYIDNLNIK